MNANDVSSMLYSILVFLSAIFGAVNLHLFLKNRSIIKECKELKNENIQLKIELSKCNDSAGRA